MPSRGFTLSLTCCAHIYFYLVAHAGSESRCLHAGTVVLCSGSLIARARLYTLRRARSTMDVVIAPLP
eukprot:1936331-Alexandrium_andersonii.AAC.1